MPTPRVRAIAPPSHSCSRRRAGRLLAGLPLLLMGACARPAAAARPAEPDPLTSLARLGADHLMRRVRATIGAPEPAEAAPDTPPRPDSGLNRPRR
jgi:hypothetical protein